MCSKPCRTQGCHEVYISGKIVFAFKNFVFARNMEDMGCFQKRQRPTWEQLYNEISATKKCMNKNPPMFNTFQKRQYIEIYLNVPGDNYEAYIPYYEIHDEDKKNLRFTVIFSSTVCLARFVLFLCVWNVQEAEIGTITNRWYIWKRKSTVLLTIEF